ncbi:MAG TPA: preprotein translocase subunit SecG [Steroidobacteraceae bacterium]|jgi:preprotein translocase subunit SecG
MLRGVILGVHVLLALMIVGLVLLQRGKGAEAGAGFGSGASGTVFGARGTSTLFSKLTAVFAALFFGTSLTLAYLGTHSTAEPTSVLERAARAASVPAPVQPAATQSAPVQTPPVQTAPTQTPAPAPEPTK